MTRHMTGLATILTLACIISCGKRAQAPPTERTKSAHVSETADSTVETAKGDERRNEPTRPLEASATDRDTSPPSETKMETPTEAAAPKSEPEDDPTADDVQEATEIGQVESVDILFLGDSVPAVIRMRPRFGSATLDEAAERLAADVIAAFDSDGDGTLSETEFPSFLFRPSPVAPASSDQPNVAGLDAESEGAITADQIRNWLLRRSRIRSLLPGQTLDPRVLELFAILDRDGDGYLVESELLEAEATLRRFDLNDDELIDVEELGGFQAPATPRSMARGGMTGPFVLLPLEDRRLRRRLGYYRWSAEALGLETAALAPFDSDGDGILRQKEIDEYLSEPAPQLDLILRLGDVDEARTVEIANSQPLEAVGADVRQPGDYAVVVELDELKLTIRAEPGLSRSDVDRHFHALFEAHDANSDGYLEAEEWGGVFAAIAPFEDADRSGAGKLYKDDLLEILELSRRLDMFQYRITVALFGRSLFDLIDSDRDGRLSRPELLAAVKSLPMWDRDGDGRLSLAEIPRHYELSIRGGESNLTAGALRTSRRQRSSSDGPLWFQRMDVNGDGAVSRREFLGTDEQFTTLDADGDGMIDADESQAAAEK